MCLLAAHPWQCRSSLYPGSGHLLLCFYIASLWLWQFLWVGRWPVEFAPSFLCVWGQRPWRSRQNNLISLFLLTTPTEKVPLGDEIDFLQSFSFFISLSNCWSFMGWRCLPHNPCFWILLLKSTPLSNDCLVVKKVAFISMKCPRLGISSSKIF